MVYFKLEAEDFSLEEITARLGISPTLTYKKGDLIHHMEGSSPSFQRSTRWHYGTEEESFDVKVQLDKVLSMLHGKEEVIKTVKTELNAACKIVIVIYMEEGITPGLYLDLPQINFIHSIQAEVDVDLYAHPYADME
ncbi:DUF4279 domain-containing protein [Jeotgalibacillus campisalis]|uniref:DUF4279 domain-containing protein n=1 Tax=Jeotgalibacillus campisalis TaxID=220754 RepID=A0A0C2W3B6_9BACL|nr:DUF4279 domain-containing protein [Jeotgalibacillus campisalis]KIL51116.1 hypothetical protein KR50_09970 [Jeotgalibacillus campisalis]